MKIMMLMTLSLCFVIRCSGGSGKTTPESPFSKSVFSSQNDKNIKKFLTLIRPYVRKSKKSYPKIRKRFLKGLAKDQSLYVIGKITDEKGGYELVYVKVKEIANKKIYGTIISELSLVKAQLKNKQITLIEEEILDWLIIKKNGTEEGGFVSLFLRARHDRYIAVVLKVNINKKGKVLKAKFIMAVNQKERDISYIVPAGSKKYFEIKARKKKYRKSKKKKSKYIYLVYDLKKKKVLSEMEILALTKKTKKETKKKKTKPRSEKQ
ncbi:MAG: DUF2314 domain-containing protein [Spirochaetota bacterium]|nr:DUF2314 domain-containing protein [Spirochaetota bacterium]